MKIFPKLLLLLLGITFVSVSMTVLIIPDTCGLIFGPDSSPNLDDEVIARADAFLDQDNAQTLRLSVEHMSEILEHQEEIVGLLLRRQAKAVEKLLDLHWRARPPGRPSSQGDAGQEEDRPTVDLSSMRSFHEEARVHYAGLGILSCTVLEDGTTTSLVEPGEFLGGQDHGRVDDLRRASWYVAAGPSGKRVRLLQWRDPKGFDLVSFTAEPVRWPDGSPAGVTVLRDSILNNLIFSPQSEPWASDMKVLLVQAHAGEFVEAGSVPRLKVLARRSGGKPAGLWRIPQEPEWLESRDAREFEEMILEIRGKKSGVREMDFQGQQGLWAWASVTEPDTGMVLIVPQEDIVNEERGVRDLVTAQKHRIAHASVVLLLMLLSIVTGASFWVTRSATRALRALAASVREMATGRLDVVIPGLDADDEIRNLARSLDAMRTDLKRSIAHLVEATTARERMESELRIARSIQLSFVPACSSLSSEFERVELFALLEPAREIGGDLYDFFTMDDHRLFFAIGDVSGKGVPAALFMASVSSLLKDLARRHHLPHEILSALNAELCKDAPTGMFVTLFLGILDQDTGEFLHTSAGHNPPLLLHAGGDISFLGVKRALPAGAFPFTVYDTQRLVLAPGDALFLYTDGITEAMNEQEELFTPRRLQALLDRIKEAAPPKCIEAVMEEIRTFRGRAPQSDDIAMVEVRLLPKNRKPERSEFAARCSSLSSS